MEQQALIEPPDVDVSTGPSGEDISSDDGLVVRRRAWLMAAVAGTSFALSAGYLWRFGQTGDGLPLAVGVVLGVLAVCFGVAFGDARTPLLVADPTGLRVRLGRRWIGVPWTHVECVEVDRRGRLRDGHVAVLVHGPDEEVAQAGRRARLAARTNRLFYDAPLVVPFGLTTTASVADIPGTLVALAGGRAPVVDVDETESEPEPTVALTNGPAEPADEPLQASADDDGGPGRPGKPRRPLTAAREAMPSLPLAKVVAALRSHPARREEVTLPAGREPATLGTLALSEPYADTEGLPEREQLKRQADADGAELQPAETSDETLGETQPQRDQDAPVSNVALIIDATTDLSARAMQRWRAGGQPTAMAGRTGDGADSGAPAAAAGDLVIGGQVRSARERVGLDVDELAERTRIRPYVIESIEVDDFTPCGGDFYARGHLRMLARVLGLDADVLVATYDETFATSPINPRAVFGAELATAPTGLVRGGASGANWGGLIAAVLVLVLVWGVVKYFADDPPRLTSGVAPTHNSAGLGSPGPGNRSLLPSKPPVGSVRIAAVGGASRVVVTNRHGHVVWQGLLTDGQARRVHGLAPMRVHADNGGVIRLHANGHLLGLMGEPGSSADRLIRATHPR